jgi:hypothetical protein
MVQICQRMRGRIASASDTTIPHWMGLPLVMVTGLRCWSSMHCHAKLEALSISNMMMWQMSGGTCVAPHSHPVKSNANPKFLHALVDGRELQRATLSPPHHQLLQQTHLQHHPQPPSKGVMQAAMGSGIEAGLPYLICISWTQIPDPTGRKNLGKFFYSTRWRRKINIFEPVWRCGRTLHPWYIQLMELQDVRPRMPRGGSPPTWQASGTVDKPIWCTM